MKVSVIVPVYNVEKYIDRCLKSLVNQDFTDIYEIIIINDGSPDQSIKICEKYAKEYDFIKIITKENAGLGMARNTGIDAAKGEYIIFVDSDDFVTNNMISYLYSKIVSNKADIVYASHYKYYNETKCYYKKRTSQEIIVENNQIVNFRLDMIATDASSPCDTPTDVSVWSAIFKAGIIKDNNIHFVSERDLISEDVVFNTDLYKHAKKIMVVDVPVYYYCFNFESLSKSYQENRFSRDKELYYYLFNKVKKDYPKSILSQRLGRFLVARARCAISLIQLSEKKLGKSKCRQLVKEIVNDDEIRSICENYCYKKLPLFQKIFFIFLKKRRTRILLLLCRINNARKS